MEEDIADSKSSAECCWLCWVFPETNHLRGDHVRGADDKRDQ